MPPPTSELRRSHHGRLRNLFRRLKAASLCLSALLPGCSNSPNKPPGSGQPSGQFQGETSGYQSTPPADPPEKGR
jgi:hypothetical protein